MISANGKEEKIASGLLNPFLAHLKTAQEQMERGGYSIVLEPESTCDDTWFTKDTIERCLLEVYINYDMFSWGLKGTCG